ncbi:transcription factor 21 isoform X2 [Brienomyrus brachyistius]|uniref:transcription factor 21 isoform X2 n=1 Tax=Brienomyrus brachyistius TaxID=42636 RepID=UPI0020B3AC84|nr:transcription factor 21 isoform X2 [Brienomyrus brachyistius]
MSTGSLSDVEDLQELPVQRLDLQYGRSKRDGAKGQLFSSEDEISTGERFKSGKKRGARVGTEDTRLENGDGRQSQRNAANARERARMRVLSRAFRRLKTSLPWVPADTKLSKLDTLRLASSYISHLRQLLRGEAYDGGLGQPGSLTWPFMVPGRPEDTKDSSPSSRLCGATA